MDSLSQNVIDSPSRSRDLTYSDIWIEWTNKFMTGAKGDISYPEAREIHRRWKTLGKLAKANRL